MRNTGLFPATKQSSEGGKSAVKNQENLKFPLCFPQGEEASRSTVSLSQWTTIGIRITSLNRAKAVDASRECEQRCEGSPCGQRGNDGADTQCEIRVFLYNSVYSQWQEHGSGNHAPGAWVCACLESLGRDLHWAECFSMPRDKYSASWLPSSA